jgi:hypothetical protein
MFVHGMQTANDNERRSEASRLLLILGRVQADGTVIMPPSPAPCPEPPGDPHPNDHRQA